MRANLCRLPPLASKLLCGFSPSSLLLGQVDLQVLQVQQQAVCAEQHAVSGCSHRGGNFARRLDFAQREKRRVVLDGLAKQLRALRLACARQAGLRECGAQRLLLRERGAPSARIMALFLSCSAFSTCATSEREPPREGNQRQCVDAQ